MRILKKLDPIPGARHRPVVVEGEVEKDNKGYFIEWIRWKDRKTSNGDTTAGRGTDREVSSAQSR